MTDNQNITLSTLVPSIATELDVTQTSVKAVLDAFLTKITEGVVAGETVRIAGLGTLEAADTAARNGYNPTTGEAIRIEASKRVSFKASKPFKDAVKASV